MDSIHVQTIWQIMDMLRGADQMENALSGSLDILCRVTGSPKGSIWMHDDQSDSMIAIASYGTSAAAGESARRGEGLIGEVTSKAETVMLKASDVRGIRLAGSDSPEISGRNILCVPLTTSHHVTGCLLLTEKKTGYTEEEKAMCEHCSALLANDIEDKGFAFRPFEDREPMIKVRNVVKEFRSGEGTRQLLKGVDLDIYPGELVVVLGESGCGKSTLLNIIGGMDRMTSGKLLVEGRDMSDPTEEELTEYRREYVGFIFQAYNLMPNLSAYENIEFIAEISDDPMDSMAALDLVGLSEKADNLPSALSGGIYFFVCFIRR